MRHFGLPYTKVEELGFMLPLVDCYAKFINPAKFDDVLEINAELDYNNSAILQFNYKIECESKLIAEGYTRHVFVNSTNMKPVKPPSVFTSIINNEVVNV